MTRSIVVDRSDRYSNRFDFGGSLYLTAQKNILPLLALQTGIGILKPRNRVIRFGCDLPADFGGNGQQTYMDSETNITNVSIPFVLRTGTELLAGCQGEV